MAQDTPTDEPAPPAPPEPIPLNNIYDDPDGDFAIISSNNLQARVIKSQLARASGVFADMFDGNDGNSRDKTPDGLPFVKVAETDEAIGRLLHYALRPHPGANETLMFQEVVDLLEITKRYDAPHASVAAFAQLGEPFSDFDPPALFAIACIHRQLVWARHALHYFGGCLDISGSYLFEGHLLDNLPFELFNQIPHRALYNYLQIEHKCTSQSWSTYKDDPWHEEALTFKFD